MKTAGRRINIAIDGPAGAGKSTAARFLAERAGLTYVNTGEMYRALTLKAIQDSVDPDDGEGLEALADRTEIGYEGPEHDKRIILDGRDVTGEIRSPEVSNLVSKVARHSGVRSRMVSLQRSIASNGGIVMDGRDIGTVVLPDADIKFFLTASIEERARRRYTEFKKSGYEIPMDELKREIEMRDRADAEREVSPLKVAEGAIVIDSSEKRIEDVVAEMMGYLKGL